MNSIQKKILGMPLILLLALMTALDAFAIDMYLPAFSEIAVHFNVHAEKVQQSLSVFLIGLAIGQVIYGPLLDRFGRKSMSIVGLTLFGVGSLLAIFSNNFSLFMTGRLIQAVGAAAGLVAPRAIIADTSNTQQSARIYAILMQVTMIAPIIAPLLGAQIVSHFHWQSIFYFFTILAIITITIIMLILPETLPKHHREPLQLKSILLSYWSQIRNIAFMRYCLAGGFILGAFFTYLGNAPYIFITHYAMSSTHFSYIFAFNALGFIFTGYLSILLLNRFTPNAIMIFGLTMFILLGTLLLVLTHINPSIGLSTYLTILAGCIWSTGFIFGNMAALTMSHSPEKLAGVSSSLFGFFNYLLGSFVGFLISLLPISISNTPLAIASSGIIALLLCYKASQK